MALNTWRVALLFLVAVIWIALSFGINAWMTSSGMDEIWQIIVALAGWWVLFLGIAKIIYGDQY